MMSAGWLLEKRRLSRRLAVSILRMIIVLFEIVHEDAVICGVLAVGPLLLRPCILEVWNNFGLSLALNQSLMKSLWAKVGGGDEYNMIMRFHLLQKPWASRKASY
jgi:hypothetical protein